MHQHIDALGRLNKFRAVCGVAADRKTRLGGLEQETESRIDRVMIDLDRRHHHLAGAEYFAFFDFNHFHF